MRLVVVALIIILAQSVLAATINVPADQPTIQAGIDAAAEEDTVLVAAGTYTGDGNRDISPGGKEVIIMSADGAASTIIDCEGSASAIHRGFLLNNSEGPGTVIEGFTIRNAYANNVGGAMFIVACGPTIRRCIFDSNYAAGAGGAMWIDAGAAANIVGCLFVNNTSGMQGGACMLRGSNPIMSSCTFYNNGSAEGSAIFSDNSLPNISFTLITHSQLPGAAWERTQTGSNAPSWECTNVWGNPGGNHPALIFPPILGNDGNISEDPLYCVETPAVFPDDLGLQAASPCAPANHECGQVVGAFPVGCGPMSVEDNLSGQLPDGYELAQNYPNPFNPVTRIDFTLPVVSHVRLTVFNLVGERVAVLADERLSAGDYFRTWDATKAASGVYLYRLEIGANSATRKMVLLK